MLSQCFSLLWFQNVQNVCRTLIYHCSRGLFSRIKIRIQLSHCKKKQFWKETVFNQLSVCITTPYTLIVYSNACHENMIIVNVNLVVIFFWKGINKGEAAIQNSEFVFLVEHS